MSVHAWFRSQKKQMRRNWDGVTQGTGSLTTDWEEGAPLVQVGKTLTFLSALNGARAETATRPVVPPTEVIGSGPRPENKSIKPIVKNVAISPVFE